jgi:exopolyphosphatase/guanosine-5'-triphosphate,3'-diphosphate pyrophosphatase
MPLPALQLDADADKLVLQFEAGWLDAHPLTQADLEQEAAYMRGVGFGLEFG